MMDQFKFHAHERFNNIQVNLSSASEKVSQNIFKWKELTNSHFLIFLEKIPKINFGNGLLKIHEFFHNVKNGWIAVKVRNLYERCVYFFFTEVTKAHVYFGVMCFLFGVLFGFGLSKIMNKTVAAQHKMRAVVASNYTGLESINIVEDMIAPTIVKSSQVLIQVKVAAIDFIDLKISEGYGRSLRKHLNRYNPNFHGELPVILGRDCSGVIISTGIDVENLHAGDEIWLSVPIFCDGTLSEYVVVDEQYIALKPPQLDFAGAAALPSDVMRVWDALVVRGNLGDLNTVGKRILINAGVSGVGLVAIQMVRAWGGYVTAVVQKKFAAHVASLGANDIITEEGHDFWNRVAARDKFDVILNHNGGPYMEEKFIEFCSEEGCVVTTSYRRLPEDSYGFLFGTLYSAYLRLKSVLYLSSWVSGAGYYSTEISNKSLQQVRRLVASGELRPYVDRTFNVEDAELAFYHIAKGPTSGKTLLRFSDSKHKRTFLMNRPLTSKTEMTV